jgi:hypothetical protein
MRIDEPPEKSCERLHLREIQETHKAGKGHPPVGLGSGCSEAISCRAGLTLVRLAAEEALYDMEAMRHFVVT